MLTIMYQENTSQKKPWRKTDELLQGLSPGQQETQQKVVEVTSGNADANDYGNFEYTTTITGDASSKSFLSLCTKNLGSDGG